MSIDESTVRALVGRVDRVEGDLAKLGNDMVAVGAAVKQLMARQQSTSQPDWLSVSKPEVAKAMLLGTIDWVERYGVYLGVEVRPCWPWHPDVVALLLAAAQHYAAAYKGSAPLAVTDFMTRHLPAIRSRVVKSSCLDSSHEEGGTKYTVSLDQLPELWTWWATDRTGLAPGLTPRFAAA